MNLKVPIQFLKHILYYGMNFILQLWIVLLDFQVYFLVRQLNLSVHSLVIRAILISILLPYAKVLNALNLIWDFAL